MLTRNKAFMAIFILALTVACFQVASASYDRVNVNKEPVSWTDVDFALDDASTFACNAIINFAAAAPGTETSGSLISTGATWVNHTAVGACAVKLLCSTSATTGDYATFRPRARADAVSTGNVECISASVSTTAANYQDLYAIRGYAQPLTISTDKASSIVNALYGCVDRTTGTSSGRTWVAWIDTHQQTKSSAGDYLMRLSHNGTVANDGAITVYNGGRMPVLINFEDAAGCLNDTSDSLVTQSGSIAISTPAGTKYLALYDHP